MKFKLYSVLGLATLLTITSCAYQIQSHMIASKSGFTSELDEPSARAQLSVVSPIESSVLYRFDVSPDGNTVVYSGVQSGGGDKLLQLWKIPANGQGSPIKITSGGEANHFYPSFSHDGQFIVYESGGQLWKVRSDGAGGKMRIPGTGSGTDTAPHLSRTGKVVFNSVQHSNNAPNSSKYLIWTCRIDGSELTQIREGSNPRYSPDGDRIVFEHDNEIWLVNDNGTNLIQLTNTSRFAEKLPCFSPDGNKIVYASNEGKNQTASSDWNVWAMNINGSEKTQITELNSWDSWPIWSGNSIYFLSARAQRSNQYIQRIWRLNL